MSLATKFILCAIAPIVIAAATYPFWIISGTSTAAATITMLLAFIGTPVYLLFLTYRFSIINGVSLLVSIPVCFLVSVLFVLIHYLNWGNSTGRLTTPDSSTIMIVKLELFVSIAILTVGSIVFSLIRLRAK